MTVGLAAGRADAGFRVTARHFRNYRDLLVTIAPTWTLLVGANGAGKTNFLELLAVSLRGLALRGRLADLILRGEHHAAVRVAFASGDTTETQFVRRERGGVTRTQLWNDESRPAPENTLPPLILFLPHEEELFESADGRRRLLGRALVLRSERHRQMVLEYQRILAQRNQLLRSSPDLHFSHEREWEVWTEQLANLACGIWEERMRYMLLLNAALPEALAALGGIPGEPTFSLELGGYRTTLPTSPTPKELRAAFQEIRQQEARVGTTLLGPHRDRVLVVSEGRDALPFLSRGQRRALLDRKSVV